MADILATEPNQRKADTVLCACAVGLWMVLVCRCRSGLLLMRRISMPQCRCIAELLVLFHFVAGSRSAAFCVRDAAHRKLCSDGLYARRKGTNTAKRDGTWVNQRRVVLFDSSLTIKNKIGSLQFFSHSPILDPTMFLRFSQQQTSTKPRSTS